SSDSDCVFGRQGGGRAGAERGQVWRTKANSTSDYDTRCAVRWDCVFGRRGGGRARSVAKFGGQKFDPKNLDRLTPPKSTTGSSQPSGTTRCRGIAPMSFNSEDEEEQGNGRYELSGGEGVDPTWTTRRNAMSTSRPDHHPRVPHCAIASPASDDVASRFGGELVTDRQGAAITDPASGQVRVSTDESTGTDIAAAALSSLGNVIRDRFP
ncbi:hypothetical protein THAOC_01862, partial [Thalassiosira oceanica]